MNTHAPLPDSPTCTAFLGTERIAFGGYDTVAVQLARLKLAQGGGLLVFDDATGQLIDYPWPTGFVYPQPDLSASPLPDSRTGVTGGVGRPRLGVVAREVTLLPRHWTWLASQSGGASAALRRLVDEARKSHNEHDAQRKAKERTYRFMVAIGGGFAGFEEASRALFAQNAGAFAERTAGWPTDVQAHLSWLARGAFVAD